MSGRYTMTDFERDDYEEEPEADDLPADRLDVDVVENPGIFSGLEEYVMSDDEPDTYSPSQYNEYRDQRKRKFDENHPQHDKLLELEVPEDDNDSKEEFCFLCKCKQSKNSNAIVDEIVNAVETKIFDSTLVSIAHEIQKKYRLLIRHKYDRQWKVSTIIKHFLIHGVYAKVITAFAVKTNQSIAYKYLLTKMMHQETSEDTAKPHDPSVKTYIQLQKQTTQQLKELRRLYKGNGKKGQ